MHALIAGDSGGVSDLITIDLLITKLINFISDFFNSLLLHSMKKIEGIVAFLLNLSLLI